MSRRTALVCASVSPGETPLRPTELAKESRSAEYVPMYTVVLVTPRAVKAAPFGRAAVARVAAPPVPAMPPVDAAALAPPPAALPPTRVEAAPPGVAVTPPRIASASPARDDSEPAPRPS